jgi:TrmH family RNA methyltransferase
MLSKNQIKFVNSLKQKKFRDQSGLFIAEGVKIVTELMKSSIVIEQIYATSLFLDENKFDDTIEIVEVKQKELDRISALSTANEVVAICKIPTIELDIKNLSDKLTLVLDNIKDPGNLGTIIRIADWYGIKNIVCSKETVEVFNPKVVQATMGSIARVNVFKTDLISFLDESINKHQLKSYGALLSGENIHQQKLASTGLIVIGNESKGISDDLLPFVTDKIKIPSFSDAPTDGAESLNAAIATAIICAEFRRG